MVAQATPIDLSIQLAEGFNSLGVVFDLQQSILFHGGQLLIVHKQRFGVGSGDAKEESS